MLIGESRQRGQRHHAMRSRVAISSSEKRLRTAAAGFPTTIVYEGTSFATTAYAPITAPSPIVTPERMDAPVPIQTSLPIFTSPFVRG
jgi:hypothetical protein